MLHQSATVVSSSSLVPINIKEHLSGLRNIMFLSSQFDKIAKSWISEIIILLMFLSDHSPRRIWMYKILTHSTREYLEKLAFNKKQKNKFKRSYLKSYGEFRVENNIFRKFIQISSKQCCFFLLFYSRGYKVGSRPVPLPAACQVQFLNLFLNK